MSSSAPYNEQFIRDIKKVLNANFSFPTSITNIELLVKGMNYTLRVECKNTKYYLKIFSASRDKIDISFEMHVINRLSASGIGVATAINSINGDEYINLTLAGEDRLAVLYTHVGGRTLTSDPRDIFLFSKALAEIHRTPTSFLLQYTSRIFSIESECYRIRSSIEKHSYIPKPLASKLLDNCYSIQALASTDCAVLSHGDAWLGNAKYVNGVIYFIDLEDSKLANRNFDLGVMAYNLIVKKYEVRENIQALLRGYNELNTSITSGPIKPYIQLRSLFVLCFLLENKLVDQSLLQKVFERAEYFTSSKFDSEMAHLP
ncbi:MULTISPECIES: phosphotransferase enzyme family protein [Pseudomonas]|jgi:Ser/Thr protein kinase RdoA (MazF antagonist)|uniref:Phosphotransferase protein n=1 Tax=Pseudomonas syringae pv. lapsa TaxID=199201 RepID=A0AB74AAM3_PSESX|nr:MULTISPECIES: phosphotransferase [Pseudomonas]ALU62487.1 phosphotransferase [Pseudomonas syringae pv. lapsa]MBP1138536.1 Ser/Thr protein kinase RdoA (MazF antagonist) [Pseudomonas sp. PvP009]PHN50128.1 phosphotransferase [Pseudomonas syringae]RML27931.1 Phosphotransferase protein [Pseudomonas syringae pv. lapsa]